MTDSRRLIKTRCLNQCCLISNRNLGKFQWNFEGNWNIFIYKTWIKIVVSRMVATVEEDAHTRHILIPDILPSSEDKVVSVTEPEHSHLEMPGYPHPSSSTQHPLSAATGLDLPVNSTLLDHSQALPCPLGPQHSIISETKMRTSGVPRDRFTVHYFL